jgi:hypothetical protein
MDQVSGDEPETQILSDSDSIEEENEYGEPQQEDLFSRVLEPTRDIEPSYPVIEINNTD